VDHYQGVVMDYLRANRSVFLNTECCIQLEAGANPDRGTHWYCDAVAVDFNKAVVLLCEVSYAKSLGSLFKRLSEWNRHWEGIRAALVRDCAVPADWNVQPWLFFPKVYEPSAVKGLERLRRPADRQSAMPYPRITHLEDVAPWKYPSWNRTQQHDTAEPQVT
jgi:hypothetical protein